MVTENKCPHCGKPVPTTALGGICPECMLKAGLAAETRDLALEGDEARSPQAAPAIPELTPHFPQLEILECLGRGGMGVVYKARQPKLDRFVALKILSRKRESGITDAEFAERFQREARALARLNHPDIVAVYDFGEAGGYHYLLMEFVDGLTLRQLFQARKLSPEEALTVVPKICAALQFAHEHGIVHRDIKPENILLDKSGRVKIADFGIAKIVGAAAEKAGLTGAKDVLGTPHYMAPEQLEKPATVDHRADIFSLGVIFYEMLTGELPLGKFQPPSRKVHVDVRLDEVVLHALEKEPDRRYQHASEVKTDVERIAGTPVAGGHLAQSSPQAHDAVWFSSHPLPELLPGERLGHFEPRLWGIFNKSLPTYRFFFSLPPLWSAGMYITDRRVLLVSHFFGLAQKFSLWFPGKAPDPQRELLQATSTGTSRVLGAYLQFNSVDFKPRWYRGRELMLRIYLREPETLRDKILASQTGAIPISPAGGNSRRANDPATTASGWVLAARWTARLFSTLLLALYGFFILGEGLPPIGSQPGGVQLNFASLGVMFLGFILGWKREGAAALLIALGWTAWHVSEGRIGLNLFLTPLAVALLYGYCWWATRGRRTGVVVATTVALAVALGLGRLFVPTSVFVRGAIVDAQTHQPVPKVELRLLPRSARSLERGDKPDARADQHGRFTLYVGWYAAATEVALSSTGYLTLTTNLGPRELGARNVGRDFVLQPTEAARNETGGSSDQVGKAARAFDEVRAVELFNDIEDFGHEFDAAFSSTNLAAAQTGTRRLVALLTDFNAVVQGTGLEFPPAIFDDLAKIRLALDERDWEEVRRLAQHNEEYARAFKRIAGRMIEPARQQQTKAGQVSSTALPTNVPPVVIETFPQSGATDVDSAITELRVTFSKPMRDGSWSWTIWGEENFPELTGSPRYLAGGRTCVLPVKLKPGKLYATWLNSEYHKDFTDTNGQPAVPYLLIFQTRK